MSMQKTRAVLVIASIGLSCLAAAATDGADRSGGESSGARDGSRPADGAIQGGSILPGESSGIPDLRKGPRREAGAGRKKCEELSGSLREQCLLQEQGSSTGGSSVGGSRRAPEDDQRPRSRDRP